MAAPRAPSMFGEKPMRASEYIAAGDEKPRKPVFPHAEDEKKKLLENAKQKVPPDGYKDGRVSTTMARSTAFDLVGTAVITLNALWISFDTDNNEADVLIDAGIGFIIVEELFCLFFFTELAIRFAAWQYKTHAFRNFWFLFDFFLVCLMVLEAWIAPGLYVTTGIQLASSSNAGVLKIFKLVRLFRMARMVRLLRAVPELMILVKGMFAATRSVFFTLLLLTVILYVFGIAFVQLTKEDDYLSETYFPSVPMAMFSLMVHGTLFDNISGVSLDIINSKDAVVNTIMFVFLVLLTGFTMLNLLIGVLCEVVTVIAATEKWELVLAYVKMRLLEVLSMMQTSEDEISQEDFVRIMQNPEAIEVLAEVEVDAPCLVDLAEIIFEERSVMTFGDFMDTVLQFRGSNTATVKDLVEQRKFMQPFLKNICLSLERIEGTLNPTRNSTVMPFQERPKRTSESAHEAAPESEATMEGPRAPAALSAARAFDMDKHLASSAIITEALESSLADLTKYFQDGHARMMGIIDGNGGAMPSPTFRNVHTPAAKPGSTGGSNADLNWLLGDKATPSTATAERPPAMGSPQSSFGPTGPQGSRVSTRSVPPGAGMQPLGGAPFQAAPEGIAPSEWANGRPPVQFNPPPP